MINNIIGSPFAEGNAILKRKVNTFDFRKGAYDIIEHYYECEITHEEFTTGELDNLNLSQVYNQYRDKFGLPFPCQIKSIREKYDVSAKKMSEILGLGVHSYRLYEQGEVPSIGNGRLILAAEDPKEFRRFLIASEELITPKEFKKIVDRVDALIVSESLKNFSELLEQELFTKIVPDHETGYRLPNLDKISNMVLFFSERTQTWTTKLNKLLFYSDFLAYKHLGFGISGLDYRAIQMGPVPSKFEKMYELISDGDLVQREYVEYERGNYGSFFMPLLTFDESLFEKEELEIMQIVSDKFKYKKTEEVINISHRESAWIDNNEEKKIISYKDYGFTIQAI